MENSGNHQDVIVPPVEGVAGGGTAYGWSESVAGVPETQITAIHFQITKEFVKLVLRMNPPRVDDEFEKLVLRMNPPRVTVDNASNKKVTLIKVDSANKRGSLLEVVQVITHLNLIFRMAYISSDGESFMDVFHVTDQQGNKVSEDNIVECIQQSLGPKGQNFRSLTRSMGLTPTAEHTTIELSGKDTRCYKMDYVATRWYRAPS